MILYSESKGGTGQYRLSTSTEKQFSVLKTLMNRKDAESLVNCRDTGREGELIFRLVYHQYGCRKLVERLWISSTELQVRKDRQEP